MTVYIDSIFEHHTSGPRWRHETAQHTTCNGQPEPYGHGAGGEHSPTMVRRRSRRSITWAIIWVAVMSYWMAQAMINHEEYTPYGESSLAVLPGSGIGSRQRAG